MTRVRAIILLFGLILLVAAVARIVGHHHLGTAVPYPYAFWGGVGFIGLLFVGSALFMDPARIVIRVTFIRHTPLPAIRVIIPRVVRTARVVVRPVPRVINHTPPPNPPDHTNRP